MLHSRLKRVGELIKEKLGEILDQKVTNPNIPPFITVHSVRVSRDLRNAHVEVTFLQDEEPEAIKAAVQELNGASSFIRGELGRAITLRYLPALHFHYNPSTRYAAHLETLFEEIQPPAAEEENPPGER